MFLFVLTVEGIHTSCDAETGAEIVGDGPDGSLEMERDPESPDDAVEREEDDEGDIEPVDVLVPVLSGHGGLCDVDLFGLVGARTLSVCRLGGGGGGGSRHLRRRHGSFLEGSIINYFWLMSGPVKGEREPVTEYCLKKKMIDGC